MGRKRIYKINEDYFNTWSHDMAYVLGFITADGSISKNKSSLSIELAMKDRKILYYIRRQLKSTHPIKITIKKGRDYLRLRLNSNKTSSVFRTI